MTTKQIEAIKYRIRKQHGTIREFCRVSGMPEKNVRHFLTGKMNHESSTIMNAAIIMVLRKFKGMKIQNPFMITENQRESIRQNIMVRHKSVRQFCQKHPRFTNVFVSNVITGRRKKIDKRVVELIKISGSLAK